MLKLYGRSKFRDNTACSNKGDLQCTMGYTILCTQSGHTDRQDRRTDRQATSPEVARRLLLLAHAQNGGRIICAGHIGELHSSTTSISKPSHTHSRTGACLEPVGGEELGLEPVGEQGGLGLGPVGRTGRARAGACRGNRYG